MNDMQQILSKEQIVDNHIYMYKVDDFWVAYERSAFYLYSLCTIDYMYQYSLANESLLIAVIKDSRSVCHPKLDKMETSKEQMTFQCNIICKGFEVWKYSILPLLSKNTYHETLPIPSFVI